MSSAPVTFSPPVPFDEHQPPAIPHNILPGILSRYAASVAQSIQVPFELPLINSLGAVAAVSQRKYRMQVHDGYSEPLNIFALAILPPGERKSAAKDACRFPLLEWEAEQHRRITGELKQARAEKQVNEAATESLRASARKCQTPEARKELAKQLAALEEELSELPITPSRTSLQ